MIPAGVGPDLNARRIQETVRSRSQWKRHATEKLYIIRSPAYDGTLIYSKDKISRLEYEEFFYVLVSAKVATPSD